MNELGMYAELIFDLVKILVAIVCGGIIGLEREFKDKPAGLRTNILVATGSCLFVIIGIKVAELFGDNPGRVIGPIITGIGFLGAGTIIRARGSVRGLTSAATIWMVAGVGMCAGLGLYPLALTTSIFVLFILFILPRGEALISVYGIKDAEFMLACRPSAALVNWVRRLIVQEKIDYSRFQVGREQCMFKISFIAHGKESDLVRLLTRILQNRDIKEAAMEKS